MLKYTIIIAACMEKGWKKKKKKVLRRNEQSNKSKYKEENYLKVNCNISWRCNF